ncbi:response regulator transcription factor [Runella sp.]|uniref:response regulator transcription factor n=1 Tax=Runella sp. TaxID=1960881 RepID=UPI003D11D4E1
MIRVTIFEDYHDMREILATLVESSEDFMLTGAYPNAIDVLNVVRKQQPDVVLMDIQMPGLSGIEATRLIKNRYPQVQVLVQTMFDDNERVFAALCMGASGYILKSTPADKILEAIADTYNGGSPMSPHIARKVLTMFAEQQVSFSPKNEYYTLSEREKEILSYLTKGMSYKMIADACGISYGTVNSHLKKIYEKLHVHSATEAVQKALLQKIV